MGLGITFRDRNLSMSTTTISTPWRGSSHDHGIRIGRETSAAVPGGDGEWSVEWVLRRKGSLASRQVPWLCASMGLLALGLAASWGLNGAAKAMSFAWIDVLAIAAATLLYVRHAADREWIALRGNELTVEHTSGSRIRRVAFQPAWVRVEPAHGDRSLIELSGQGRRIVVGRFVRPELRYQLAEELRWALRRWQQRAGAAAVRTGS